MSYLHTTASSLDRDFFADPLPPYGLACVLLTRFGIAAVSEIGALFRGDSLGPRHRH